MIDYNGKLLKSKQAGISDYLLVFLILQVGWISVLTNIRRLELIVLLMIFIISYNRNKKVIFDIKIMMVFIIYTSLTLIQGTIWGFSLVSLITSFTIVILLPYYLFKGYNISFFIILEKVIRVLTIIALSIWLIQQFVPGAKEVISGIILSMNRFNSSDISRSMIFYTYWEALDQNIGFSRNAGFSNEPAAFSVPLILAIIINYSRNIQLFSRRNILYYVALITTFSTTGYLAFFALGLLLIRQKRGRIIGLLIFPFFVFGTIYAFNNLEFLQRKVQQQIEDQTSKDISRSSSGRLLGARRSLLVLSKYPFHGRGLLAMTKPSDHGDPEYAEYGWLSQMARFGIIFGALFMYFFLKGVKNLIDSGGHSLYEFFACAFSIMILLSAQPDLTGPIFMVFFFMGLYNFKPVLRREVLIKDIGL
jgi:hypothetical protein